MMTTVFDIRDSLREKLAMSGKWEAIDPGIISGINL